MPFKLHQIILGSSSPAFSPLSIAGLQLWLKADAGLTLSVAGFTGTGTTVAQAGNTLTGVATKFLSECVIGDNITAALGLNGNVTAIASDTSLTLDSSATIGAETPYTITPVAGTSDRVTTWADQSGNGPNGTQSTNPTRPAKVPNVQNGMPGILGRAGTYFSLPLSIAINNWTLFAVIAPSSSIGSIYILDSQTGRLVFYHTASGGPNVGFYDGAFHPIAAASNTLQILEWVLDSSSSGNVLRNGTSLGTAAYAQNAFGGTVGLMGSYVGGNNYIGYVYEFVLYAGAKSAADRSLVRTYLKSKWGTP